VQFYDKTYGHREPFNPEIAVIADEKSCYALTQGPQPIGRHLIAGLREPIYRLGAPSGFYQLEDLVAEKIPPKKMYIFVNNFMLTDTERAAIVKQCAGKMCIFFYANGLINATVSADNMSQLLGVPLTMTSDEITGKCKPVPHVLTKNVSVFGPTDLTPRWPAGAGSANAEVVELSPVITLDTKDGTKRGVDILATYAANGQPAAWIRNADNDLPYTAVYIGTLTAPEALMRNIAVAAGVHVYADSNDVIEADAGFVAIHAVSDGEKVIVLPRSARVSEALTGTVLGERMNSIAVSLKKGETRMYNLE
jgi:hypothetical protein